MPGHPFENGFDLTLRPERIDQPLRWRRGRMIFVNSMSDLFHKAVPTSFIDQVFETMEAADWHTYKVLTKRSPRLRDYMNNRYADRDPPPHIWTGVSVEDRKGAARVAHLRAAKSAVRFHSVEPLIGSVGTIDLTNMHWVIAGGESGPNARVMRIEWAREIRDACREQRVPFFFKQWGGVRPKSGGRLNARSALVRRPRTGAGEAHVPRHIYARTNSVVSWADEFTYVDLFAGPWQSNSGDYSDTSFGIALRRMTEAKAKQKELGRQVKMVAHLVEKDSENFVRLTEAVKRFPEVETHCHSGLAEQHASTIASAIPARAFRFVVIDPKGVPDVRRFQCLISPDRTEVLLGFMFQFANSFAGSPDRMPTLEGWLGGLQEPGSWRSEIAELRAGPDQRARLDWRCTETA